MSGGQQHRNALPAGYRLENFGLETVLGHGGFGITYRAVDEDLQQVVAIKEYLPREVAFRDRDSTVIPLSEADREIFEWGLERFLDEARTLARFRHRNIVGVRRFIRANGTAYLVMDYCEGDSLESVLAREGTLPPERLEVMLEPLLDALEALHAAAVTHRDIKPGNIYLREDGSPVLLDFGAARQALAQHSRSVTAMATPGYAALEQYSTKGKQGPWTDIYGLGATLYRCVTGQRPQDATDRMLEDELVPAVEAASGHYPRLLLQQIDAAVRLRPEERPQSAPDWRRLGSHDSPAQAPQDGTGATEVAEPKPDGRPDPPRSTRVAEPQSGRAWGWVIAVLALFGLVLWVLVHALNQPPGWSPTVSRNLPAPPRAQDTSPSSHRPLIEGRYRILGSQGEVVRDTVTGLEWQRCSVGEIWTGNECVGEAHQYTWDQARQVADRLAGWRLPTIDELRTLTFCSSDQPARFNNGLQCEGDYLRPTIVLDAFPGTNWFFWSGSPDADYSDFAWNVGFGFGGAGTGLRGGKGRVRLVRGESISGGESDRAPGSNTDASRDFREPPHSTGAGSSASGDLIEGRYKILGVQGQIVRDMVNSLEWQRCALGQTWNGRSCLGEAGSYTWEEARQAADRVAGWQLPAISELRTLTYCSSGQPDRFSNGQRCEGDFRSPTIVKEAFPNTPSSYFWSDSHHVNLSHLAWLVAFNYGSASEDNRGYALPLRLVRRLE